MAIVFGKAHGKVILFGEHAVVYDQPAIAIPVTKVNATARILPNLEGLSGQVHIQAPDIALDMDLDALAEDHPLAKVVHLAIEAVQPTHVPAITLQVNSTIPISAGMGSSAAISVAVIRALTTFLGAPLPPLEISALAYEVEKIHHGTPSGIDNNVIAYQKPVYFWKDHPIEFLSIENPSHWVIADTGEGRPTRESVSAVRELYDTDPKSYEAIFHQIGEVVQNAKEALIAGDLDFLGWLMDKNQRLLEELNVSSPKLDVLIRAAREAGAAGAKLSGGGCGGNMIALASPEKISKVEQALIEAGAVRTITTLLPTSEVR